MQNWQLIQQVLESLYHLSGVAVAVAAFLALRQLSLAKRSLRQSAELSRMSARREAYRLAAQQCHVYMNDLVPLMNKCDEKLRSLGISTLLESFSVQVSEDGIQVKPPANVRENPAYKEFPPLDALLGIVEAANALEAFSVLFTSGVAAEGVAFRSIGTSFCNSIKGYAPVLLPLGGKSHFQNLLQLFHIWQLRIERERLRDQHNDISKQLERIQEIRIQPLGT